MIHVRPYRPDDRNFALDLAPRLTIGMAGWRDPARCLAAVRSWVTGSIEQAGDKTAFFIVEDEHGERLGFATVTGSTHFTGDPQAYVGELVTTLAAEGQGVGKALLQACEQWAVQNGYHSITLTTGAANTRALGFYRHLGYREEDITLTKLLNDPPTTHITDRGTGL